MSEYESFEHLPTQQDYKNKCRNVTLTSLNVDTVTDMLCEYMDAFVVPFLF